MEDDSTRVSRSNMLRQNYLFAEPLVRKVPYVPGTGEKPVRIEDR